MIGRAMRAAAGHTSPAVVPVAGRSHRYAASDLAGDGTAVSSWADGWGTATATQATSGSRPVLHTTGNHTINGQPVVTFDGVDDFLSTSATFDPTGGFTVAAVVRPTDLTNAQAILGSEGYIGTMVKLAAGGKPQLGRSNGQNVVVYIAPAPAVTVNQPCIIVFSVSAAGEYRSYINSDCPSAAGVTAYPSAAQPMRIGSDTGGLPFVGDIGEIDIWNRVLSDAEVRGLVSNLAQRYGITLARRTYPNMRLQEISVNGEGALVCLPRQYQGQPMPLIMYWHGVGGDGYEQMDFAREVSTPIFTAQGFITAGGLYGSQANWGNQACIEASVALYRYMIANYAISKVFAVGASMGGLGSLLAVVDGRIPIAAWLGASPVCDLAQIYTIFGSGIRTAYGIASDGSDYAAKTAGHDPMLMSASAFGSIPMRGYTPPDDQVVNKDSHIYALRTKLLASRPEFQVVETLAGDGGHNSPDPWWTHGADMAAFFQRYL